MDLRGLHVNNFGERAGKSKIIVNAKQNDVDMNSRAGRLSLH